MKKKKINSFITVLTKTVKENKIDIETIEYEFGQERFTRNDLAILNLARLEDYNIEKLSYMVCPQVYEVKYLEKRMVRVMYKSGGGTRSLENLSEEIIHVLFGFNPGIPLVMKETIDYIMANDLKISQLKQVIKAVTENYNSIIGIPQ